jgi:L-glyceraldehyde 3-phosphate reductase
MTAPYAPAADRYDGAAFRYAGRSGLQLPTVALGLWQNFGAARPLDEQREIVRAAFDRGVTHVDLANNYGPPPGAAEENFGRILDLDLRAHRDELVISTKAGYDMWSGPYGRGGSRKHLLASLDQSLHRLGLDYVDIFYSHCYDPAVPLEETMGALAQAVRSGKALYVGISSYPPDETRRAARILNELGVACTVHQPSYSLLNRWVEDGLLDTLGDLGIGCVAFSPLAQGLLSERYLDGLPDAGRLAEYRAAGHAVDLEKWQPALHRLAKAARDRGLSLPQLAIAWLLGDERVTTALVGARTVSQLTELLDVATAAPMSADERAELRRLARP